MPYKFTLYPHTRTSFNMALPILPAAQAQNWRARETEFKAQLAAVGLIEDRDYVQSTERCFREDSRPFVVSGIAKTVYALIRIPQEMIEKPPYTRVDGREVVYAMDAAQLATEIMPSECQPSDEMYLKVADDFLCSILQACVNTQVHNQFLSTVVTKRLNDDLVNIMQIPKASFFELPKYKLAYCSLYHAMCSEKIEKTTQAGWLSFFSNTPLFDAYKQLMAFYTRDCVPKLRSMSSESMLEMYRSQVASLNQAGLVPSGITKA